MTREHGVTMLYCERIPPQYTYSDVLVEVMAFIIYVVFSETRHLCRYPLSHNVLSGFSALA